MKRAPRPAGRRSSRLGRGAEEEQDDAESSLSSDSELSPPPEDTPWYEFETICVTRAEWESFVQRFATSKHPDERQMHNYLAKEVLPKVVEVLQAEHKKAALEAALAQRKRSSRIALRESEREQREREEAELRAQRAQEAAERRAEQERVWRLQNEAQSRHQRDERVLSRAERLLARERAIREREAQRESELLAQAARSEDWHLRCEVCHTDAINPTDAREVVACEKCGIWQHTACWDQLDLRRGRAPRAWDAIQFVCQKCEPEDTAPGAAVPSEAPASGAGAVDQDVKPSGTLHTPQLEPAAHIAPFTAKPEQQDTMSKSRALAAVPMESEALPSMKPENATRTTSLGPNGEPAPASPRAMASSSMAPPLTPVPRSGSSTPATMSPAPYYGSAARMSPRGTFALRSVHLRSPLSQPVEPVEEPTAMALDPPRLTHASVPHTALGVSGESSGQAAHTSAPSAQDSTGQPSPAPPS